VAGNSGGNSGGQVCDSVCKENIVNQVTAALTPIIKMNACGETCQKGIACNVLNYDGFMKGFMKPSKKSLADAIVAGLPSVDEWAFYPPGGGEPDGRTCVGAFPPP
jgi:hypothetical protein